MSIIHIPLAHGKVAIIDEIDADLVLDRLWHLKVDGVRFYAKANITVAGHKRTFISMHRFVLGLTNPVLFVDHINGDGLDNRRSNLRVCTKAENNQNQRKSMRNEAGFKGVFKEVSSSGRIFWRAAIGINYSRISLGQFDQPEDAARAYDDGARRYFGEFSRLNFPEDHQEAA